MISSRCTGDALREIINKLVNLNAEFREMRRNICNATLTSVRRAIPKQNEMIEVCVQRCHIERTQKFIIGGKVCTFPQHVIHNYDNNFVYSHILPI